MDKSPDAFRTISEVAEWLDVPTHVLRFWESRFSQIKPVKRAGGRRYYRPSDMRLIGGVKVLLHDQGMTIRAVQKLLREEGVKHVSGFSQPLDSEIEDETDVIEGTMTEAVEPAPVAPAPAARSTREAAPAPVDDAQEAHTADLFEEESETAAEAEDEPVEAADEPEQPAQEDAPIMFRRSTSRDTTRPTAEDPAPEPEPTPEPEPSAPPIPETPDVPTADPLDDDPSYASDVGLAARLATVPASRIAARAGAIRPLRDRLVELRDRLS